MENVWRIALMAGWLLLLWLIELRIPLRANDRAHTLVNIGLTVSLIVINFLMAFAAYRVTALCSQYHFGVFEWLKINVFWQIIIGLLFLDFWSAYLAHVLMHKFTWLWNFHRVHHSDEMVDVSTAFRQHPLESVYRIVFQIIGLGLLGAPMVGLIIYQTISSVTGQLEHANIRLNPTLDKVLSVVFITPNFHKPHHSCDEKYANANYGNIFSIWDRLFGTYQKAEDVSTLTYGLGHPKNSKAKRTSIIKLLGMPFSKANP
jgi:sterol desaturase/sphingolipid hydroxylase (fatty acid hydroxylase superfamily)